VEQMAAALAFPSHDPHGAPIPTRGGQIESSDPATLADARAGDRLRIRAVRDEDAETLRSIAEEGLLPGVRLEVRGEAGPEREMAVTLGDDPRLRPVHRDL